MRWKTEASAPVVSEGVTRGCMIAWPRITMPSSGSVELALRGVPYRPMSGAQMLSRNLLVYGLGGIIVPFIAIKVIDLLITPFMG